MTRFVDHAAHDGRPGRTRAAARANQRGQVIVIFAGAMLTLVALCAVVVDVAWYWTNNLRMQRAADAAALAGVVWLPARPNTAYDVARAEAAKNGYTDGAGGVVITTLVDPSNSQRLRVTIDAPVGTFFARAVGLNSWQAHRDAKADYVLPVPMGSPQNYYGVGFYEGRVPHVTTTTSTSHATADSGLPSSGGPTAVPSSPANGGTWTASGGQIQDAVTGNDNVYARTSTDLAQQKWTRFGLAIPTPAANQDMTITGLQVRIDDAFLNSSCSSTKVGVELSWDAGANWSTQVWTPNLGTNTSNGDYTLGNTGNLTPWGGHAWAEGDFSNANFQVRLTADKGCTTSGRTVSVDQARVQVWWDMATTTTTTTTTWTTEDLTVPDPLTGTTLTSQGFWGAIFTSGGVRENGDKYAPNYIGGGTTATVGSASPTYDAGGYDYTIELPGGSGQVSLFDPIFCATGDNGHGGSFGAGDHWTSHPTSTTSQSTVVAPVSITYRLYNTRGTLLDASDDGAPVATLAYDPGSAKLADLSGRFGTVSGSGLTDCADNPAHNQWVSLATGLNTGIYRLNVNTTLDAANMNVGAENLFSIWVKSGGSARVYGGGRMAAYTNLDTGQQKFYFAQIERVHAGKTMEIRLFDPGETSGNAYLRLLSPDGNSYHYQRFDWTADNGTSGTNVTEIQTSNGSPLFNNREITITVPLPTTYGQAGLNPPGDVTDEDGWWLIEYQLANGNDTTTWSVNIRGNPVHLVVP